MIDQKHHHVCLFPISLLHASMQICYEICTDELPGFEYFGTQYSFEVQSFMPIAPPTRAFLAFKLNT